MSEHRGLTRRHALGAASAAGVAYLVAGAPRPSFGGVGAEDAVAATCVMTPAKTEGPYFVDEKLNRSDIREGQDGVPLVLTMHVFDGSRDCAPVEGAQVDIWHANAGGKYSDESANGTVGEKWLRGYQVTDSDGKVEFTTIYPGWYSGRAIHIHFKVRANGVEFTSQMFFTDEMNATVMKRSPYSSRGTPDTTDTTDNIYGSDGAKLLLQPQSDGSGGYTAEFSVGVSGGSGSDTTTSDTSVAAAVLSVHGTSSRRIRTRIRANEAVRAVVTVTRSGHTLVRTSKNLSTGSATIAQKLAGSVRAGAATVRVKLTDSAGNTKTVKRTVHIPS
ncbi:MAG TPA: intradiol ring-cleavage dioxygenase [Thermoleophilaceae bacterium]